MHLIEPHLPAVLNHPLYRVYRTTFDTSFLNQKLDANECFIKALEAVALHALSALPSADQPPPLDLDGPR